MAAKSSADVVVIGGGVIGCMTAYYLTGLGLKPVVVEAEGIATGASGLSGGILTPYSGSGDAGLLALSRDSLRLHDRLKDELPEATGIDYGYDLRPYLRCVFTEDGAERLKKWAADREREGFSTKWLSAADAKAVTPWLTGDILGALMTRIEPTIDSYRFTVAAMRAAEKAGAVVVSGRVTGLSGKRGMATGVKLAGGGEIASPHTVIATGPWAGLAGEWLGYRVPVSPQKGEMVYMDRGHGGHPAPQVSLNAWDAGGSVTPKRMTETIIGATRVEAQDFMRAQTPQARAQLVENASRLSKWVKDAPIVRHTACLRPYPADGKPYVGRAPGWDGVWIASGHWSEGIHYAPLTGKWTAGMIVTGNSEYDISAIDAGRIAI